MIGKNVRLAWRLLGAGAALCSLAALPHGISAGFSLFLGGALVSTAHQEAWLPRLSSSRIFLGGGLCTFALSPVASKAPELMRWGNYLVGVAFSFFLFGAARLRIGRLPAQGAIFLSDISYSLYLVHFPLVVPIAATFVGPTQLSLSPIALAIYTGLLVLLVACGWLFWLLFERHTDRLRDGARSLLARRSFERPRPGTARD